MYVEEKDLLPEFTEDELNVLRTREPRKKSEDLFKQLQLQVMMFLYVVFAVGDENFRHWKEIYRSKYGKYEKNGNFEIDERDVNNISRYRGSVSQYFNLYKEENGVFEAKIAKAIVDDMEKKWNEGVFLKDYDMSRRATVVSYVVELFLTKRLANFAETEKWMKTGAMDVALDELSSDKIKNRRYYADAPGAPRNGDDQDLITALHSFEKMLNNLVLKEEYKPENGKEKREYLFAGAELYPRCREGHPHLEAVLKKLQENISERDPSCGGIEWFLVDLHERHRISSIEEMIRSILNMKTRKSLLKYLLYPIQGKTLEKTFPKLGMSENYYKYNETEGKGIYKHYPILNLVEGYRWLAENHLSMDWDEERGRYVPVQSEEEKTEEILL